MMYCLTCIMPVSSLGLQPVLQCHARSHGACATGVYVSAVVMNLCSVVYTVKLLRCLWTLLL